jgi:hypothetical protein
MDRNVGLWIDHKQAYAIWHDDGKVEVIPSQIEPPAHYSGGTRLGGKLNSRAGFTLATPDGGASVRHDQVVDGFDTLPNEDSCRAFERR